MLNREIMDKDSVSTSYLQEGLDVVKGLIYRWLLYFCAYVIRRMIRE